MTGDLRWKPKLREDYKEWAAAQGELWLAEFMLQGTANKARLTEVREELAELRKNKGAVMQPFFEAQGKYFNHIYVWDKTMWWVRGFLQVSSAMTLDGVDLEMHPMDFHAICFHLKRRKEKKGPRSLRFRFEPGQPPVIVVDPWGTEIVCRRSAAIGRRRAGHWRRSSGWSARRYSVRWWRARRPGWWVRSAAECLSCCLGRTAGRAQPFRYEAAATCSGHER